MSLTLPVGILDHRFARDLPEMAVPWQARQVSEPELLVLNEPLAAELGLDPAWLQSPDGLRLLTGNLPDGAGDSAGVSAVSGASGIGPVAQAYAGNQFGGPLTRLGDGRALLLGELTAPDGSPRDLHLKGSGPTPFSRGGDGLAAIGPMLREHVIGEAMHALGIPTTRSLAVVATSTVVYREVVLPGAVLARTASSHLRVGSFQYAAAMQDRELLRRLADHAIARHYPQCAEDGNPYLAFYRSVVAAQAALVARWMLAAFVHGVMNTDNMTVSGETIDYGPCAFMEAYDPATVFSSIDEGGRYAYGNQPLVAQWNLARLGEALVPLFADDQDTAVAAAVEVIDTFPSMYQTEWSDGMRAKLGLPAGLDEATVAALVDGLLNLLQADHVDWTSFFRGLGAAARGDVEPTRARFLDLAGFDDWSARWRALDPDADAMDRVNPLYIPRNHLVEAALAAANQGDLGALRTLLAAVTDPYRERPGLEQYAEPAPQDFGRYRTFCGT